MVESYKNRTVIFAGGTIAILLLCFALGNYFMLKKNLEAEVDDRMKQIRHELHKIGYSGNPAMLQDGNNITAPDNAENSENFSQIPAEDLVNIISYMNRTLSQNIQNLRNMSRALDNRMDSSQQKMKIFEELVGRNGIAAQKGRQVPSDAPKGIDSTKKPKEINTKTLTKNEKETKNRQVTSAVEKRVYFSLALTKTLKSIGPNHVIVFDLVYSNEGFGYNAKTGKFSAPVTGTYFFMFFIEVINEKGKIAHVNLYVDGKEKASARAETWHDGQDVTSANAVITHLTQGQIVWIQTAAQLNKKHDIDKRKTTFTGVLLFS